MSGVISEYLSYCGRFWLSTKNVAVSPKKPRPGGVPRGMLIRSTGQAQDIISRLMRRIIAVYGLSCSGKVVNLTG